MLRQEGGGSGNSNLMMPHDFAVISEEQVPVEAAAVGQTEPKPPPLCL